MKAIQVLPIQPCAAPPASAAPTFDPDLVNFAALLAQLADRGVEIERQNLGQQPMAFAQNPVLEEALQQKEGTAVLPLIFLDGEVYVKGRYPIMMSALSSFAPRSASQRRPPRETAAFINLRPPPRLASFSLARAAWQNLALVRCGAHARRY